MPPSSFSLEMFVDLRSKIEFSVITVVSCNFRKERKISEHQIPPLLVFWAWRVAQAWSSSPCFFFKIEKLTAYTTYRPLWNFMALPLMSIRLFEHLTKTRKYCFYRIYYTPAKKFATAKTYEKIQKSTTSVSNFRPKFFLYRPLQRPKNVTKDCDS